MWSLKNDLHGSTRPPLHSGASRTVQYPSGSWSAEFLIAFPREKPFHWDLDFVSGLEEERWVVVVEGVVCPGDIVFTWPEIGLAGHVLTKFLLLMLEGDEVTDRSLLTKFLSLMIEGDEVTDRTTGEVADQEGGNYLLVPYHLLSKSTYRISETLHWQRVEEADIPTCWKKRRQRERYFMATVGNLDS